ncbi:MAG: S24/S26 family peptidase [Calditrichaeota bacterium]|nr:S24/S26 family peptidase [Calditrichota bacterium]
MNPNYKITAINLLTDQVQRHGSVKITARGASMKPLITDGCQVKITRLSSDPKPGMITAINIEDRIFIHRIIDVSPTGMIKTKGDNLPFSDGYIPVNAIIGEVVSVSSNEDIMKLRLLFADMFEYLFGINKTIRILSCMLASKLFNRQYNKVVNNNISLLMINSFFSVTERFIRLNFKIIRKLRMMY